MTYQPSAPSDQRPEFVTLIAIYHFVTAGILVLISCLIPAVLFPTIFLYLDAAEGIITGIALATGALALLLGFAFASIAVGWGMLRQREWARMGAIVLAAFALVGFPVWTIVAILVLVYLTSEEARYAFRPHEAPLQITKRTISTASPDLAPQAAYKAEPPAAPYTSPAEETRPVWRRASAADTNPMRPSVSPEDTLPIVDETGASPLFPPSDPGEMTEYHYDAESDVSDHYRRWKASLPQEDAGDEVSNPAAGVRDAETPEVPGDTETQTGDEPLSSEEGDVAERIWGPGETAPGGASEKTTEVPPEDPTTQETSEIPEADEPDEDEEAPERR